MNKAMISKIKEFYTKINIAKYIFINELERDDFINENMEICNDLINITIIMKNKAFILSNGKIKNIILYLVDESLKILDSRDIRLEQARNLKKVWEIFP